MLTLRKIREVCIRHLCFVGPGLVAAVAYVDPGNWATDLEAGARWGYKLLFIVLVAGLAAVVLQVMSVRLGAVTSKSLPANTRELFLGWEKRWPQYRVGFRLGLYILWALAEIAIIATDLAELLGSAIALNLLFPSLPLFAGVLITAADVMVVLIFFRTNGGRQGMMLFEIIIVALVLAVFVSFMILLDLIQPVWRDVFFGLVPSKTIVDGDALYVGVGIIGATVMPHALFLGSELAGVDRLDMLPREPERPGSRRWKNFLMPSLNPVAAIRRRLKHKRRDTEPETHDMPQLEASETQRPETPVAGPSAELGLVQVKPDDQDEDDYEAQVKAYEAAIRKFDRIRWVDLHVWHATVDTAYSLLGFAVTINSSILTLAGAAFYYGNTGASADDADIFGAHKLISNNMGNGAGIIFALALLCAGQSASITATLAGQVVSEGFLEWKTSPMIRRLITRLIGVVPAAAVASAVGAKGLDTMLVASQVVLSIVLPTVAVPLVYLCASKHFMFVDGPVEETEEGTCSPAPEPADEADDEAAGGSARPRGGTTSSVEGGKAPGSPASTLAPLEAESSTQVARRRRASTVSASPTPAVTPARTPTPAQPRRRRKSYASPLWLTILGSVLCTIVIVANGYVIVHLAMSA